MPLTKPKLFLALLLAMVSGWWGCGDTKKEAGPFVSGTLTIPEADRETDAPVLVALTTTLDRDALENHPRDVVVEYLVADKDEASFRMDLSRKKVKPGDSVYLIAFVDRNYAGAVPFPDEGDVMGVYVAEGRISPAITLSEGENEGFHIVINREVFDYEASISGNITGEDTGMVTVVAYGGDVDSSNFTTLDFNGVIGFTTFNKADASPAAYTLDILPYGKNVPVENVQVFALLDKNNSQTVDAGDRIGFYSQGEDFSTLLTITDGLHLTDINVAFTFDVRPPGSVAISGDFTLPADYVAGAPPVFIAVFDGADPGRVLEAPFSAIRYFSKLPADIGCTRFSLDLTASGLKEGDKVMVVGLWDRDFAGGLPNITPGDFMGLYVPKGRISPAFSLKAGENSGLHVDINREVFDYEAAISGTVLGNDQGPVTLVAYNGDIDSSDFAQMDFSKVVGFTTVAKSPSPIGYTLKISPYGQPAPLKNVMVIGLLDKNGNDAVDAGDRIGFYRQGKDFFTPLTITDGLHLTGIDLAFAFDVPQPSLAPVFISGDFSLPAEYKKNSPPVYIAVFQGADPTSILEDPFVGIRYFSKVTPGETTFSFDLTQTGLGPEDEIMVMGLWDRDFKGGLPNLTKGDVMGIYFEPGRLSPATPLSSFDNRKIHLDINREVFDYTASVAGTIRGEEAGQVTLVAYAGDITSSDFQHLDVNDIIAYQPLDKKAAPIAYTLEVLPFGKNAPIEKVMIIAVLDNNKNQRVDGGDRIGFYKQGEEIAGLLTIHDGDVLAGMDIEFVFDVPHASHIPMSLAGTVTVSNEYLGSNRPIFLLVFDAEDPGDILDDPFAYLNYFYRLPADAVSFDMDLSNTHLVPGDSVMVAALWDRDFSGGFPGLNKGDRLGIAVNKQTYAFTTTLQYGKNLLPGKGGAFDINKRLYDFSADLEYAIDLTGVGNFDMETARLMVLSVHVDGVEMAVTVGGDIGLDIDMDYLLGVDVLPGVVYDYIGIGNRKDPETPRKLPILTALYDRVVVWEQNNPPDPLINGVDHGRENERTAYLVAVLDKNGNGALDGEDEIGYYGDTLIEISDDYLPNDLPPWLKDILIPEGFRGTLTAPAPVKRIVRGRNQEPRPGGAAGPYWISHFKPSSAPLP